MPTLYVTAPPDDARGLATDLVDERLAACVNVLECQSIYRWDGEVHDEPERVLLVKTTEDACDRCSEWIEQHHPYDVPCIERFDEDVLSPAFEQWREREVE